MSLPELPDDDAVSQISQLFNAINGSLGVDADAPLNQMVLDTLIDSLPDDGHKLLAVIEQSARYDK